MERYSHYRIYIRQFDDGEWQLYSCENDHYRATQHVKRVVVLEPTTTVVLLFWSAQRGGLEQWATVYGPGEGDVVAVSPNATRAYRDRLPTLVSEATACEEMIFGPTGLLKKEGDW